MDFKEMHKDEWNQYWDTSQHDSSIGFDYEIQREKALFRKWLGIGLTPGMKVLEAGCGYGRWTARFADMDCYSIGLDFSNEAIQQARNYISMKTVHQENISLIQGDMLHTCFEDNSLDVVISLGVLEHIENYFDALVEFKRILKPGGKLFISVPNRFSYVKIPEHLSKDYSENNFSVKVLKEIFIKLEMEQIKISGLRLFPGYDFPWYLIKAPYNKIYLPFIYIFNKIECFESKLNLLGQMLCACGTKPKD